MVPENGLAGRRVFIVEDESMVMMLLQDALDDIGCQVVGVASRFKDALEKAKSLSFDVAILDVNLNGQHTFPIADVVIERGLAVVFSTGYGVANLPTSRPSAPLLQKPFQQRDLEQGLRAALDVRAKP
jgi:CheY-like chemotaxis protein